MRVLSPLKEEDSQSREPLLSSVSLRDSYTMENSSSTAPLISASLNGSYSYSSILRYAFQFDGNGNFAPKEFDLKLTSSDSSFYWYHFELPRSTPTLAIAAKSLIDYLHPTFKLNEITSLVCNGPFCGTVNGYLIFRINSPGPMDSRFTFKLSAIVTNHAIVSVSLGKIPRLEFSRSLAQSLLKDIPKQLNSKPSMNLKSRVSEVIEPNPTDEEVLENLGFSPSPEFIVLDEDLLEELLRKSHPEDADNPIPLTVSRLLVHIVDTHVDQVQDLIVEVDMKLDDIEHDLDKGANKKKQFLDDRTLAKMHLDLQRVLQSIAHGEVVFPKVKDKIMAKKWCDAEDAASLETIMSRLKRNKENVGFLASRITALQAGLDQWQSEQINRKLYYLSFLSIVFLPLSLISGIFGMNVGGVPWVPQTTTDPGELNGFRNVMYICLGIVVVLFGGFLGMQIYNGYPKWKTKIKFLKPKLQHTETLKSHRF